MVTVWYETENDNPGDAEIQNIASTGKEYLKDDLTDIIIGRMSDGGWSVHYCLKQDSDISTNRAILVKPITKTGNGVEWQEHGDGLQSLTIDRDMMFGFVSKGSDETTSWLKQNYKFSRLV